MISEDGRQALIAQRKVEFAEGGQRVKAVRFSDGAVDDNLTVPPGTLGTVNERFPVDDAGTISVRWDNGRTLGLLLEDEFEVVQ